MAEPREPKTPKVRRKKTRPASLQGEAKQTVEEAMILTNKIADAPDSAEADALTDDVSGRIAEPSVSSDETVADQAEIQEVRDIESTAEPEPAPVAEPTTTQLAPVVQRRSGAVPVIFGGVVAAIFGAVALYFAQSQGWITTGTSTIALEAQISSQTAKLTELTQKLDALQASQPDLTPLAAQLAELAAADDGAAEALAALTGSVAALSDRIDATDARVAEVETQPIPKAELPAEVTAAFEAELAAVQGSVDARFEALQTVLDTKLAAIEAAQSAAVEAGAGLARAADLAKAETTMVRIGMALDSGEAFADALQVVTDITDIEAPREIADVAEDGAPTLVQLQAEFPAAARSALEASVQDATADGSVDTFTAFLRTQLGARSLQPREGADPDAVLSRAEAAVANGDLTTALAELGTLPEAGQAEMAQWRALAETRSAALAAAAEMTALIESN